jgi:GntR family transcriptional regulator
MVEPMYRQIAEDLRRQIENGELPPGSQLRTEIELREAYNASRNTVLDAIKSLIIRGLVETRPGQGTFVVEKINPYVTTLTGDPLSGGGGEGEAFLAEVKVKERVPTTSDPRVEIQKADQRIAQALQVEPGSQVVSRHQQRFIDNTPFSLQTSFYPMRLVETGAVKLREASNIEEGTVAYLARTCGISQAGYRDLIGMRTPDEVEMVFFKLPADGRAPVLEVLRIAFDTAGQEFRVTTTVYAADRNQFVVNVGAVPPWLSDPGAT